MIPHGHAVFTTICRSQTSTQMLNQVQVQVKLRSIDVAFTMQSMSKMHKKIVASSPLFCLSVVMLKIENTINTRGRLPGMFVLNIPW